MVTELIGVQFRSEIMLVIINLYDCLTEVQWMF